MKHLDLFSGIGGFALAADRVFGNVEHTFCEIDPFCQEVLKKHWPKAKIYGDIRTLTNTGREYGESGRVNEQEQDQAERTPQTSKAQRYEPTFLLTGGFPCQPFSQAGRRKGTADDRYLWPEMLRVIREFHPRWVIGENVGGLVTWSEGLVLEQVHLDLEAEGYEVQAFIIPAVSVNAPHRRDRVWIVANRKSGGQRSSKPERNREGQSEVSAGNDNRDVAYTTSERLERGGWSKQAESESARLYRGASGDWDQNWSEVATRLCRVDDGVPRRLDRNPRLKALGNAIVPQVAEEIMRAIWKNASRK